MQRYREVQRFPFSLDQVLTWVMDPVEPLYSLEELQSVAGGETLEVDDDGERKRGRNRWDVRGQLPRAARALVKPGMLSFVEHYLWDRPARTYSARIVPAVGADRVDCEHRLEFVAAGDATDRVVSGHIEVRVPVVGAAIEKAVVKQLLNSADQEHKLACEALARKLG